MNTKLKKALYESIMKSVAKTVKSGLNEYNEWAYHKGAEYMEIELNTCKVYLLTEEDVISSANWDLTEEDLYEMESIGESNDECMIKISENGRWILIKK